MKHRFQKLLLAVFVIAAVSAAYLLSTVEQESRPPNILLIVLDDFGYNDLGANGNSLAPTPRLDALAAQGARYTRHYADASCSVARAALMTGTFPAIHGMRPNHLGLSIGTPTIASVLQQANYRTEHIGKWHIASATLEQSPSQFGFDHWFGFLHNQETGGPSADGETHPKPTYVDPWLRDNQSPLTQYPGHLTDILTQRAITFLDQQKAHTNPWFLNLWYYAPHAPVEPPADIRSKFPATEEGAYHALVAHLDSNIGEVLDALERNGQSDDTLVILLSDNGGLNAVTDSNYPFYGRKTDFLEGGLRTPMLMRWPGHIEPNTVSDELVSLYDIFPTIADASGVQSPAHLIGRSLFDEGRAPTPQLYWEYSDSQTHSYSVLSAGGRWRLTRGSLWINANALNDLAADPSGKVDVLNQHPEVAAKLTEEYLQWRKGAREVVFDYMPLSNRGAAILRGADLLRSPGFAGFTFAIGVTSPAAAGSEPQVIVDQVGRWALRTLPGQGLLLDVLGQTLEGPPLPPGQCSELVITTQFNFTTLRASNNWSMIDLYVNGERVSSVRKERPTLQTWGYANPTYIGSDASGGASFSGELSRPIILNERVVPDEESAMIGNGISGVPPTCAPAQNEIDASIP